MALEFAAELQAFGLIDIILWLLSFAIVYGVLSQVGEKGVPEHKGARAIISIVIAFMVLFATPAQLSVAISKISSSLLLIILGLLCLIVFIEAAGVKVYEEVAPKGKLTQKSIFEVYSKHFAIALLFIAVMIFIGAGGLEWIGLADVLQFGKVNVLGAGLFIMIVLAIIWMIAESKE